MKIPGSVRDLYRERVELYRELARFVDDRVRAKKEPRWHYESRVKSEESFAQKLETGRAKDPKSLEDFFACTLVVENTAALRRAEEQVRREFDVVERRPADDAVTHRPENFRFDYLRLYVRVPRDEALPPREFDGVAFEVQIKTFLQHAWSIATHDLVYKSDVVSWPRSRIAFQLKAMLEHAETSIAAAEFDEVLALLPKSDARTSRIVTILDGIRSRWPSERLPADCVRLAENVEQLLHSCSLSEEEFFALLDVETESGQGTQTLNLSPFGVCVQTVLKTRSKQLQRALKRDPSKGGFHLFLPPEVPVPEGFDADVLPRVVRPKVAIARQTE